MKSVKTIRAGILGAGSIAVKMARTMLAVSGVSLTAVASRDLQKAQSFIRALSIPQGEPIPKAYGSYEEMAKDPDLDLIYVCTPQSFHFSHTMLCLSNGKSVLCEKAFMLSAAQAKTAVSYAREKGLFLGEAIWTRFLPITETVRQALADGVIGTPQMMTAKFGVDLRHVQRLTDPYLGGGALLDLGVYALTSIDILFGHDIAQIQTCAMSTDQGVDARSVTTFHYRDGRFATAFFRLDTIMDNGVTVFGDKGYMVIPNVNNWESATAYDRQGHILAHYDRPQQITGFEYELQAAVDAIRAGAVECPQMPHERIIGMMEQMDTLRSQWGVTLPGEENINWR